MRFPWFMNMAMTINGDGANETFWIDKIWYYPENEFIVYNRWGTIVYETRGYNNDWDGTRDGEPLPIGTYYYILKLNDKAKEEFQDYLTIIRP